MIHRSSRKSRPPTSPVPESPPAAATLAAARPLEDRRAPRDRPPPPGSGELAERENETATVEEFETPPLRGKVHPRLEMDDAVPTLDDETRHHHQHPSEAGRIELEIDPDAADAAADLAVDLGAEFLEGATRGQDMSDIRLSRQEAEGEGPLFFIEGEPPADEGEAEEGAPRRPPRRRAAAPQQEESTAAKHATPPPPKRQAPARSAKRATPPPSKRRRPSR